MHCHWGSTSILALGKIPRDYDHVTMIVYLALQTNEKRKIQTKAWKDSQWIL